MEQRERSTEKNSTKGESHDTNEVPAGQTTRYERRSTDEEGNGREEERRSSTNNQVKHLPESIAEGQTTVKANVDETQTSVFGT